MHCSPSVAFPLDTIKESSLSPSEGPSPRDTDDSAAQQPSTEAQHNNGRGERSRAASKDLQEAEEAAALQAGMASGRSEGSQGRVLILDGGSAAGTHTTIRGQSLSKPVSFADPYEQAFDPANIHWRVTL
jgi:hypothetical protein